jgi:hypothetical protein
VLTWLARRRKELGGARAIVWGLFVYDAAALIAMLVIQLQVG